MFRDKKSIYGYVYLELLVHFPISSTWPNASLYRNILPSIKSLSYWRWHLFSGLVFLTCLMNFLSSWRASLVFFDKSSVTEMTDFLKSFEAWKTSSLSLKFSKVTRTGLQPCTSGPVYRRLADWTPTSLATLMWALIRSFAWKYILHYNVFAPSGAPKVTLSVCLTILVNLADKYK